MKLVVSYLNTAILNCKTGLYKNVSQTKFVQATRLF